MWNKIENYDYASVPEGNVRLGVIPATDPNAHIIYIDAVCGHYEFMGKIGARFVIDGAIEDGLYYLDLADYVPVYWRQS